MYFNMMKRGIFCFDQILIPSWLEVEDIAMSADDEFGEDKSLEIEVLSLNALPFSTISLSLLIKKLVPPWLDLYPSSDTSELLSHANVSLPFADVTLEVVEDMFPVLSQLDFEAKGIADFEWSPLGIIEIVLFGDFCSGLSFEEHISVVFLVPPYWLVGCSDDVFVI